MTTAIDPSELYKQVIGKGDVDYYLRWFAIFDEHGGRLCPSWNWAAALFGPFWVVFRKAHNFFWLYVAAAFLATPAVRLSVEFYLLLFGFLWIGLAVYANAFYYRHVKNRIAEAQRKFVDTDKLISYLKPKGGVSAAAPLGLIVLSGMVGVSILMMSAREDYAVRLVVASASAEVMKRALPQAGSGSRGGADASRRSEGYPRSVESVTVGEGSVVTITFSGTGSGCRRCAVLENVSLTLVPVGDGSRSGWKCRSRDLPAKYFPKRCLAFE